MNESKNTLCAHDNQIQTMKVLEQVSTLKTVELGNKLKWIDKLKRTVKPKDCELPKQCKP